MIYALSFAILLLPVPLAFLLTSRISRRAKLWWVIGLGAFWLIAPIVVIYLSGGTM